MKKTGLALIALSLCLSAVISCHKKAPPTEAPVGDLKILSLAPKGENLPISVEGISVMFNQAMVPLTTLDEGRSQTIPLEISPEVEGKFYWLGTHGFIFRPAKPFDPATLYKIKIPASVESIHGKKLGLETEWFFSTVTPRVTNVSSAQRYLMPTQASVRVEFNVAMNTRDVEKKILFSVNQKPENLSPQFTWEDNDHTLILSFKDKLPWASDLSVILPKGLQSKTGSLPGVLEAEFKFITPPETLGIDKMTFNSCYEDEDPDLKAGQETVVDAGAGVCYCFNQPIIKDSFEKSFTVRWNDKITTPEIKPFFQYSNQQYYETPQGIEDKAKPFDSACVFFMDEFNRSYTFNLEPKTLHAYSGAKTALENRPGLTQTNHAEAELRSTLTKSIVSAEGTIVLPYRYTNLKSLLLRAYKLKDKANYAEAVKNETIQIKGHYDSALKETVYDTPYFSNPISLTGLVVPVSQDSFTIDQARMPADYELALPLEGKVDQSHRVMANLESMHLSPGLYLIEAQGTQSAEISDAPETVGAVLSMIQVTPFGLVLKQETDHTLAWVTDIESGKPKAGVEVLLTLASTNKIIHQEKLKTNSDGVAITTGNWDSYDENEGSLELCAEINSPYSYSCMREHQLGYKTTLQHGKNYFTYIQTDRPIYKPGQTVYFSAFSREVKEGRHFMPGDTTRADILAIDASGETIFEKTAQPLEKGGVLQGIFNIDDSEDAPRGNYSIKITLENGQSFTKAFSVSSYKKPSFKVDLKTPYNEIINKKPLEAQVVGAYFFGAPMANAKANISLLTNNYIFSPEGFESYNFIDDDDLGSQGYNDYAYVDYEYDESDDYGEGFAQGTESSDHYDDPSLRGNDSSSKSLFDKEAKKRLPTALDAQGQLKIDYAPDLTKYPLSQEITIEAAIQDPSHEEVSGFTDIVVHKANHYVGLKPQKWVYGEKDKAEIDVATVATDGKPAASKTLKITFLKRDYKFMERRDSQGYWQFYYETKDEVITTKDIKTNSEGLATAEFEIPQSGTYRVVATGSDGKNALQKAAVEISAWGSGYAPWKLQDAQTLELVPDKESYKIGETAHVLIKSLVPPTQALLTLERGRLLDYRLIELGGSNANRIDIPITEGLIPNIYLNVIAHVGRDDQRAPMLFKGDCALIVEPEQKRALINVELDKKGMSEKPPIYKPGDTVKATFKTTDPAGQPLKTHLIVSVADESVLRLLNYQLPDLVEKFYYHRDNSVQTSSSLISLKAGDGGPADGRKRRNFKDTAHFEGHIITDEKGVATLSFKLPDDLTTWVFDVFAISESKTASTFEKERLADDKSKSQQSLQSNLELTDATFVGSFRTRLMTTLPLSLRAALPRFAAWGDQFFARVIANNQNPQAIDGTLVTKVSGDATLAGGDGRISFQIPANSEKAYDIKLNIQKPVTNEFVFSAEALDSKNILIDGFEKSVPVKDRYAPEKVATSGTTKTQTKEQILLPSSLDKSRSTLQVEAKASLAVALAGSLKGLISYPYSCSEQQSASLIALIIAHDFVDQLGESYFDLVAPLSQKEIKKLGSFAEKKAYLQSKAQSIIDDLQAQFIHSNGGVKYWPTSLEAHIFPSIQTLFAFEKAMEKGLQVNSGIFNNILAYVNTNLAAKEVSLDLKAYGLWVTSLAFQFNTPLINELVDKKDQLSTAGLSYLVLALSQQSGTEQKISLVTDRLVSLAKQEPRHTSWPASNFFAGSSVKNTALATLALMKTENPLVERGMAFLLNRKKSSFFELTQDPLAVSLTIHELARRNDEFKTDFTAFLDLGDQSIIKAKFDKSNLLKPQEKTISLAEISDQPVDLTIRKEGEGTLYYDLLLTYYLPPKQTPPREEGLIIARDYFEMSDVKEESPLTTFTAGKNYKAHMILMVPQDMNFVFVRDVLPAGFEPIDMTLATSSLAASIEASQNEASSGERNQASRYDDEIITPDFGTDYNFVHQEIHDDAIIWSDTFLPAGTYHIRYPVRAITAGTFFLPGAEAYEFYEPEIFGRSKPGLIEIKGE